MYQMINDALGAANDYERLKNLPQINNVTLTGNKSLADLGITSTQVTTMPTASASNVGQIVQFIGASTSSYINGYFYKCVDSSGSYSWVEEKVQDDDEWTATALVASDNTVTFTGLSNNRAYTLYCEDKLIGITSMTKTGSGSNVTIVYEVNGASTGDICKLRILK